MLIVRNRKVQNFNLATPFIYPFQRGSSGGMHMHMGQNLRTLVWARVKPGFQLITQSRSTSTSTEVLTSGWHTAFIGHQTEVEVEVAGIQNLGQMSPRLEPKCSQVPTSVTFWLTLTKVLDPGHLDFHLSLVTYECSVPTPCQNLSRR